MNKETPEKIHEDAFHCPACCGGCAGTQHICGTTQHPLKETPTEEWEKEKWVEQIVEDVLLFEGSAYEISHKEVVKSERDRLREIVLAELRSDIELTIFQLLTSHDAKWQQHEHDMYESLEKAHREEFAELARKIKGMKRDPHNDELTSSDVFVHNEALDAVLALLGKKNV